MEKRRIIPEDLFRMRFVGDAAISPDGASAVAAIWEWDSESDSDRVGLWLLSVEDGSLRRLTSGLTVEGNASWSPDGTKIAFISRRTEKPQVHLIDPNGGEAWAVTSMPKVPGDTPRGLAGVAGAIAWSPDGSRLAFSTGPQTEARDPDKPYRVTRPLYRFDGVGYVEDAVQDIYVVPVDGGEPKRLTNDGWMNVAPRWAPDGQGIVYHASLDPSSHDYGARLRLVDLDGRVREIPGPQSFYIESTGVLPDGRVACYGRLRDRPAGSKRELWVVDPAGGEPDLRTTGLPLEVGGHAQPDAPILTVDRLLVVDGGEVALVPVQDGGTVHIYRVALSGPESWERIVGGERSSVPLSAGNDRLLYKVTDFNEPGDLYVSSLKGEEQRRLTRLNAEFLEGLRMPEVEHLKFEGKDNTPVEGWLVKPPEGKPPYPTVLFIHGGPHSAFGHTFSFDSQMLAGAGFGVLLINQRGSSGYGSDFATIVGRWGTVDYEDLMAGVDHAIDEDLVDEDRLGVFGISGGGYLSAWIIGQTDRFKAAVPEAMITNFLSMYGVSDIGPIFAREELGGPPHEIPEEFVRCSPITYAHRCTTPTLLIHHEHDWRCPAEQAEQLYAVLRANGCVAEMLRLPKSSHGGSLVGSPAVRRAQNEALLDWMRKHVLNGKEKPEASSETRKVRSSPTRSKKVPKRTTRNS